MQCINIERFAPVETMAPLRDYSMQNEEKLDLSTDIDGHTREDDDDAAMRDNYLADNLCEDCWEEDTGYCRCLVWDWGREDGLMTQQRVFALFRQEKVQERAERAQRQTTRKARVNLIKFRNSLRLGHIVEYWHYRTYLPESKLVQRTAKRFKVNEQRLQDLA